MTTTGMKIKVLLQPMSEGDFLVFVARFRGLYTKPAVWCPERCWGTCEGPWYWPEVGVEVHTDQPSGGQAWVELDV